MLNSLDPFRPVSLWKSTRNKQREAYVAGLLDAMSLALKLENKDELFKAVTEQVVRIDGQYEE